MPIRKPDERERREVRKLQLGNLISAAKTLQQFYAVHEQKDHRAFMRARARAMMRALQSTIESCKEQLDELRTVKL